MILGFVVVDRIEFALDPAALYVVLGPENCAWFIKLKNWA